MKKGFFLLIPIAIFFAFFGCLSADTVQVEVCEEGSEYIDFYEENGVVHIVCTIEIINRSSTDQTIKITGISEEDVEVGLLVTPHLVGVNTENKTDAFQVNANSRCMLNVDFCGEYAGIFKKSDRLIPDVIEVVVVK